jgi:hypothetical protein
MIGTLTALLAAHVLADFVFQTRHMAGRKRHPATLILHGAIVLLSAQAALGQPAAPSLIGLALAHMAIDAVKARVPSGLSAFLADQAAHAATLLALALWQPGLWAAGYWAGLPGPAPAVLLHTLLLIAGFVLAVRAGGFAVGLLMEAQTEGRLLGAGDDLGLAKGLPRGGLTIGWLERGLIFILILADEPGAIGFLIAAKSVLRFGTVAEDRAASEYVIIGTLASFGWAIAVTLGMGALAQILPPLEIGAPLP